MQKIGLILTFVFLITSVNPSLLQGESNQPVVIAVNDIYQQAIQKKLETFGIQLDDASIKDQHISVFLILGDVKDRSLMIAFSKYDKTQTQDLISERYIDPTSNYSQILHVNYILKPNLKPNEIQQVLVDSMVSIALYSFRKCETSTSQFDSTIEEIRQYTVRPNEIYSGVDILPLVAFYAGECSLSIKNYDKAADYFEISLQNDYHAIMMDGDGSDGVKFQNGDPSHFQNYFTAANLAWIYIQLGKQQAAFDLMTRILDEHPFEFENPQILSKRAQLYAQVEQYSNAIADLSTAIELDKNNLDFYLLRGKMYLAQYEWDSALADYNKAIALDPTYADAYYERGVLYYSILQTGVELREEAFDDFHHYLEIAPDGDHAADAARYTAQIEKELDALSG